MLRISKLASYATIIMTSLSAYADKLSSAHEIAAVTNLPIHTVSKILKKLLKIGVVKSARGVNGGYQLGRAPKHIALMDIISAIDGEFSITGCCNGKCVHAENNNCPTQSNWQLINHAMASVLRHVSLHDMSSSLAGHPLLQIWSKVGELYAEF